MSKIKQLCNKSVEDGETISFKAVTAKAVIIREHDVNISRYILHLISNGSKVFVDSLFTSSSIRMESLELLPGETYEIEIGRGSDHHDSAGPDRKLKESTLKLGVFWRAPE